MNTSSIPPRYNRHYCWLVGLALVLGTLLVGPLSVSAASNVSEIPASLTSSPSSPSLLLAQASFNEAVDNFYDFLKVILNLIGVVMVIWSGFKFHDGQVREGTYALVGALVVLCARIVVQQLAGAAS